MLLGLKKYITDCLFYVRETLTYRFKNSFNNEILYSNA